MNAGLENGQKDLVNFLTQAVDPFKFQSIISDHYDIKGVRNNRMMDSLTNEEGFCCMMDSLTTR